MTIVDTYNMIWWVYIQVHKINSLWEGLLRGKLRERGREGSLPLRVLFDHVDVFVQELCMCPHVIITSCTCVAYSTCTNGSIHIIHVCTFVSCLGRWLFLCTAACVCVCVCNACAYQRLFAMLLWQPTTAWALGNNVLNHSGLWC